MNIQINDPIDFDRYIFLLSILQIVGLDHWVGFTLRRRDEKKLEATEINYKTSISILHLCLTVSFVNLKGRSVVSVEGIWILLLWLVGSVECRMI